MNKSEIYKELGRRQIPVKWIGTTKNELQKILDASNELKQITEESVDTTANEISQDFLNELDIESRISSSAEVDAFFTNRIPNTEINVRPNTLLQYLRLYRSDNNILLRFGVDVDGAMTYKFLANSSDMLDFLRNIQRGYSYIDIPVEGSDVELMQQAIKYGKIVNCSWISKGVSFTRNSGAYMPYYHTTRLDLSRYQFYRENQRNKNKESCFLYALRKSNIPDCEIDKIKIILIKDNLNTNDIKFIAEQLNICLNLQYCNNNKNRYKVYNKNGSITVNIGLVSNHYFINEETNITLHAIQYYNEAKYSQYFPNIYKHHDYFINNNRLSKLSSFDVISNIIKYGHIIGITMSNAFDHTEKLIEYTDLVEPRENEYKEYDDFKNRFAFGGLRSEEKKQIKTYDIICADFETFIDPVLGYHIPYCLCYSYITEQNNKLITDGQIYSIYGLDCAKNFLNRIKDNTIIITHNLSFDFKMLQDHLKNIRSYIKTGTQVKTVMASFKGHTLVFKDNCAFLSGKLSKLPEMFNLDSGDKEAYPYSLINNKNFDLMIPIKKCMKYIKNKQKRDFLNNCKPFLDSGYIDIEGYTIKYCSQDVRILTQAFCSFANQILEISDGYINILHSISLSQVADDYFRLKGCYNGTYKLSGIAHDFIRRCVVGGRVMCANNMKQRVRKVLNDFDAVSLYPSAMARLKGYLLGLPKVIHKFEPDLYDHYFIEIIVNNVGIHRSFPLASIKTNEGIHNFTNDLIGRHIYVDKTTLEDLIKWQNIDFTFVRGYYFDEGYNDTIVSVIHDVFDKRVALKKEKNTLEQTYKLIMNSSYGKLCQKPITRKIVFKNNSEATNNFIINNYQNIVEYTQINNNLFKIVMEKSIVNHFAPVHMACQILSMSKRIMNEVMCLAEDNAINIYYQDTDSMHIEDSQISLLSSLYKEKYERELIGSNMGQFHNDFSVKDKKAYNIKSIESIFLGKKCYIDKLQYNIPNDDEYQYSYHLRMKGVNSECIYDEGDPFDIYNILYKGFKYTFDMARYCVMECTKNLRMVARKEFLRSLQF